MDYWLVNRRLSCCRWCSARIELVDELVLHKNGYSRNNNYLHTVLNNMTLLFTKYYQNWSMNVKDIASQSNACHFRAWLKRPIFRVHDSQGSAETLVRRGAITNYHLIACSFNNTSAKNYQNRFMFIEVIMCNVSVFFWDTVYNKSILFLNAIRINYEIWIEIWIRQSNISIVCMLDLATDSCFQEIRIRWHMNTISDECIAISNLSNHFQTYFVSQTPELKKIYIYIPNCCYMLT